MRVLRLTLTSLMLLAASVFAVSASASANGACLKQCGNGGSTETGISAVAYESTSGGSGSVSVGNPPAWLAACSWTLLNPGDEIPLEFGDEGIFFEGPTEPTWVVTCPTSSILEVGFGDTATGILEIFPDGDVPIRLQDAVIREAVDQVPFVAFYPTAAPEGTVEIPMITRFPTTLWIPDEEWQPISATASIPPLSVTATATPVQTVWSGGDEPAEVTCEQGVPIRTDIDFEDNDFSCSMLFHNSTNVQENTLTLTVTWDITYVCSAVCGSGTIEPSREITSTRVVRVGEILGVITSYGD